MTPERPSEPPTVHVSLTVNGRAHGVDVPSYRTLVDLLRYDLGLTGTKETCGVGVCGACTVIMDGAMVASCIVLSAQADGATIETIEGVAQDGRLHPVQEAFLRYGGFQCGACTPGHIMAAKSLLEENPHPSEAQVREWLMGNLCRCTGYYQIVEAVTKAMADA